MKIIREIAETMQTVFTIDAMRAAQESGFVQRASKLDGPLFVQTLVFTYLSDPDATVDDLTQTAAARGLSITGSGLVQRCTDRAAPCLHIVLRQAVRQVITADPATVPLLQRFTGVYVQDGSTSILPPALADLWHGCGGSSDAGAAAIKLQIQLDLCTGALAGRERQHGRDSDRQSRVRLADVVPGTLYLADLGYFSLPRFATIAADGGFLLTRPQAAVVIGDEHDERWDDIATFLRDSAPTAAVVDVPVRIGAADQLPCRLVAVRVPQEVANQRRRRLRAQAAAHGKTPSARRLALCAWTVFLTTVPVERLSVAAILTLGRARWQIELLITLGKSHGKVDESRSERPYRVLCDVYAKLLAMIVQHGIGPDRALDLSRPESDESGPHGETPGDGSGRQRCLSQSSDGRADPDWVVSRRVSDQSAQTASEYLPTALECQVTRHCRAGIELTLMHMGVGAGCPRYP